MMNVKGIWFDEVHSYKDLNLILSDVNIPPATIKTSFVDIPGADGSLDLTEALGAVRYKDRSCSFVFSIFPYEDFEEKKKQISNLLNGKRCKIRLDKDPEYYWFGRCSVNNYSSNKNLHKITVKATVEPYKYKNDGTVVFVPLCGSNLFDNSNLERITGTRASISTITSGVRATWEGGKSSYNLIRWLPVQMLMGYTITFSAKIEENGVGTGLMMMGYANADGSKRKSVARLETSGATSFRIENVGEEYSHLAIWFYANNGTEPENVTEGAYVDYLNVAIGLGDTHVPPAAFEPYEPFKDTIEVILTNGRKAVCPTIICTGDTTFNADGLEFTLGEGTHKVLDFQLLEGETTVSIKGTGAISIIYQEGDL